jgi:hypothetical protein
MKTVVLLVAAIGLAATAGLSLRPEPATPAVSAKVPDQAQLPPGHPPIAERSATVDVARPPHPTSAIDVPFVEVPRAVGKNAKNVAELYAERTALAGHRVRVRGQVIKVTPAVLGKNYLRLRDGSTEEPSQRELVVTSQLEAKRGDIVQLEGTLRTDVNLGIGVIYPVLLEDAQGVPEP